jgi:hypothetical protein
MECLIYNEDRWVFHFLKCQSNNKRKNIDGKAPFDYIKKVREKFLCSVKLKGGCIFKLKGLRQGDG